MLGGVRFPAGERTWPECAGEWDIRCLGCCATLDGVGVSDPSRLASTAGGLVGSTVDNSIERTEKQE